MKADKIIKNAKIFTADKDADFLVFDKDLLTAEKEGFSYNKPSEVYFKGKAIN